MELENTNGATQTDAPELILSEPHFDDEATVLSARPVVPLSEVGQSSWRRSRGWTLALTIVAATVLGALGSALYLSQVNRESSDALLESEALTAGAAGESTETANTDQIPALGANEKAAPVEQPEIVGSEPAPTTSSTETDNAGRRPVARRIDVLTHSTSREERKAARRLAKEQQREQERENRRARDLTRIREIFEGPQRP